MVRWNVCAMPVCLVGQGGQQNVVVVAPTVFGPVVGDVPVSTTCVNCQRPVITTVNYETGGLTWLIFAILCFLGSVQLSCTRRGVRRAFSCVCQFACTYVSVRALKDKKAPLSQRRPRDTHSYTST